MWACGGWGWSLITGLQRCSIQVRGLSGRGRVVMLNVPCEKSTLSLSSLITEASLVPVLSVFVRARYARWRGRAWQRHIWLLSGPWKCNSDLEVLRCLFIARSLGAWPYSQWHFQPLICRRIVMECLAGVTLCSYHTIFSLARGRAACVAVIWL